MKSFYNFGVQSNDNALRRDDDHHYLIQKGIDFKFFNNYYSAYYLSTNGVIKLVQNENDRFDVSENPKNFPINNYTLIAPFWSDISTESTGDVFYRLVNDSNTLNRIACDIRQSFSSFDNFKPTWASVITWYQVKAHLYSNFL